MKCRKCGVEINPIDPDNKELFRLRQPPYGEGFCSIECREQYHEGKATEGTEEQFREFLKPKRDY